MTSTQLKVVVYDDERGSAESLVQRLNAIPQIAAQILGDANDVFRVLEDRRRLARRSEEVTDGDRATALDDADIFVVDYDLALTQGETAAETGERVAYLAQSYSSCRLVVALNQFNARATFDLTLLGHLSSFADLNISNDQIDNPGLWGAASHDGFNPWGWPDLLTAPSVRRAQQDALIDQLDTPLLEVLGLGTGEVTASLTRSQLAWLTPDRVAEVTARKLVQNSKLGLKPSDFPWRGDTGVAQLAACRINKWLLECVLPGQNVIVDAPHLASRFPSLIVSGLQPTDLELNTEILDRHRFTPSFPIDRVAWLWPQLLEDDRITEVADPFAPIPDNWRFTEDSSRFRAPEDTRAFVADVAPFSRRYVTRDPEPDELGTPPWTGAHGLAAVQYQPAIQFAL